MIRVLCFGRFYDEIPGGMQRHIEHLFASLQGRVNFVHLVPSRDRHAGSLTLHGFPVHRTRSLNVDGSVAISPGLLRAARRLHDEEPFDLIHLHFPDPMSHLASIALPWRIPRIISWHADIVRHRALGSFYRPLLVSAVRNASAIIVATPSHVTGSPILRRYARPGQVRVIPYGFGLEAIQRPHPLVPRLAAENPGRLVLAVGRHVAYKGFDVLIRAAAGLDRNTRVLMVGAGPLTRSLQSLIDSVNVGDRVKLVGFVDDGDLPAYYQACDVFCLPSVTPAEAFGIVQIEAMACGKPVVSTRLGTGVDFVNRDGETGLTVAPGDSAALHAALDKLLSDDGLRSRMGAAAKSHAETVFSLDAMAARTLAVYEEASHRDRPSVPAQA